jgi:hypothetical protein
MILDAIMYKRNITKDAKDTIRAAKASLLVKPVFHE